MAINVILIGFFISKKNALALNAEQSLDTFQI